MQRNVRTYILVYLQRASLRPFGRLAGRILARTHGASVRSPRKNRIAGGTNTSWHPVLTVLTLDCKCGSPSASDHPYTVELTL